MPLNWMVAVDNSSDSELALLNAITTMDKDNDVLFVLHVIEPVSKRFSWFTNEKLEDTQKQLEQNAKEMIDAVVHKTKEFGVKNCVGLVMVGYHTGETICEAVNEHNIKVLVMGRRGLSFMKRIVIGSNSKYCLEHANCDVLIAKKPLTTTSTTLETELSNLIVSKKEIKAEPSTRVYQVVRGHLVSETTPTKPTSVEATKTTETGV